MLLRLFLNIHKKSVSTARLKEIITKMKRSITTHLEGITGCLGARKASALSRPASARAVSLTLLRIFILNLYAATHQQHRQAGDL